jgi:hypothetical protein
VFDSYRRGVGPLEDALAEQRRRSEAMTAAFRHARYAPDTPPADDVSNGDDPVADAVDDVDADGGDEPRS